MQVKYKVIILLLLISLKGLAQEFKAGAIGGATFSQVHGDSYVGFNKIGLVTGLYVSRSIGQEWAGQFEIVYKQKGSRHNPNESKGDYTQYKLSFDYLEVPVLAKHHMKKFTIEAGVAFGFLISSSEEDQYGKLESEYPFEDYEMSGIVGINYHFHDKMFLNFRWSYAMTRVRKAYGGAFDHQKPPHWMDGKFGQYNHLVSLCLYYEFERLFSN